MQRSNFHQHSTYSDGHATVREMIEAAISYGFTAIGFSDHSYAPEQIDYCMPEDKVQANFDEIKKLEEEYRGKIAVYAGLELDGDSQLPDIDYDFIIASVHEMHYEGKSYPVDFSAEVQLELADKLFGGSMVNYAEAYYKSLVDHVKNCKPDIIGHFDLVTKYSLVPENDPRYVEVALSAVRECMKYTDTFELNTGAIARGLRKEPYPAGFILDEIKRLGGRVIVTSDCHYPERMVCWFNEAEEFLSSHGFEKNENASLNSKVSGIEIWE
ncbi:MAG: histidinol-phosphatase HisJ family protein [Ruminococcaceae bacterium]|nr:histidinol-phosphatase HisJ family protein [Oscillospiraceae bacterium]